MKLLRIGSIVLATVAVVYFATFGVLYLDGYRIYRFPTMAMQPTIKKNELAVGRLAASYRNHLRRFDVAIFRTAQAPGEIYAKRIVGLPGERIRIDGTGVFIDDKALVMPSAVSSKGLALKVCDLAIPSEAVLVLGDFTPSSLDSRYLGPIPKADILGYMVFKK